MHTAIAAFLTLFGLLLPTAGLAQRLQVPLDLSDDFIESLMRDQAFTGAGGRLRFNEDVSGCQYLELRQPGVSAREGLLLLNTVAEARVGRVVAGRCLLLLNWNGRLEFTLVPSVGDDRQSIVLRTASWRALRPDGQPDTLTNTVAQWLDQYLPQSLKQNTISFARPISELQAFLRLVIAPEYIDQTQSMLDSLAIDRVTAADDKARVLLGMDAPLPVSQPALQAEPALSAAELLELEGRLDTVDSFFTYTIKSITGSPGAEDANALLDVLMTLRYELIDILGEGQRRAEDPARTLFISAWDGLTPTLRLVAGRTQDRESVLRYLTFISAGDVLRVLDELGPAAGIEVSSDGLRRLARILIPDDPADPLLRDDAVDPELRRRFGFGEPLPPPQFGFDTSWLDFFIPSALAATLDPATVKRLNNWVPKTQDMKSYLPMVRDVLHHVVGEQLRATKLESSYHQPFRWLVFATAWQESCWRQFVAEKDKRVPLQSGSGDLGMMQINPKVWRGFYDLQGLRWDIVYNARTGVDILEHYLTSYALKNGEQKRAGGVDNLARSTYAAYNGGPRQYDRYRRKDASSQDRKVDGVFYEKYREVKSGRELAVTACYGG